MSKLFDEAIGKVRKLPEADQDAVAEFLLMLAATRLKPERLDDETRAALEEAEAQAQRGEFVPDEQMNAFFKRVGA